MPKPRMALRMIKDVLRSKWEAGLSHAQTAAALRISKGAVAKYLGLAEADPVSIRRTPSYAATRLFSAATGVRYPTDECSRCRL